MTKKELDKIAKTIRQARGKHNLKTVETNFIGLDHARKTLIKAYKNRFKLTYGVFSHTYDFNVSRAFPSPKGKLP